MSVLGEAAEILTKHKGLCNEVGAFLVERKDAGDTPFEGCVAVINKYLPHITGEDREKMILFMALFAAVVESRDE